jgi:hypothetical protein
MDNQRHDPPTDPFVWVLKQNEERSNDNRQGRFGSIPEY